jgi:hypothetical protein
VTLFAALALPEHTWPVGQTFPQLPQLALSRAVSTHSPAQRVWPETHETAH